MSPRCLPPDRRAARKRRFWLAVLLIALTIWGLTDVRRRGRPHLENPLKHRTDLTVYTEAGAAFFDGRPPYEVSNVRGWRYLYPPLFAMLLAPLHALPTQDQVTVWFFLSLLACWGCYHECRLIVRHLCDQPGASAAHCRRWFPWLGAVTLVAGLLPTLNCLQRGQVGIWKLYLLLLGFRLVLRGRSYRAWMAGGIVLAAPIVIKVIPIMPVAFLLFLQLLAASRRAASDCQANREARSRLIGSTLGLVSGLVLFLLLVPAGLIGFQANLRHLDTWSQLVVPRSAGAGMMQVEGVGTHFARNQSLGNAAYRFGNFVSYAFAGGPDDRLVELPNPPTMAMDSSAAKVALLCLRLGIVLALLVAAVRLGRRGDDLGQAVGFALACAAMLVVSPIARGHYFMFLVPTVLLLPLWLDRQRMPRAATAMAMVPGALLLLHYCLLRYTGRIGLLGLGTTGWLVAAVLLIEAAQRRSLGVRAMGLVRARRPVAPVHDAA